MKTFTYKSFHAWGTQFIPFQAHAGMAFFFTTVSGQYWYAVAPAMLAVIAGKEYMDSKESGKYSWFDLGSWAIGASLAIGWGFI